MAEVKPTTYDFDSPALKFKVLARFKRARAAIMELPHSTVETPVFMPVGTQGTIKALTAKQVSDSPLDFRIILGNTYHLQLRPTSEVLAEFEGLHNFMGWDRSILTDSGGFQVIKQVYFLTILCFCLLILFFFSN